MENTLSRWVLDKEEFSVHSVCAADGGRTQKSEDRKQEKVFLMAKAFNLDVCLFNDFGVKST